MNTTLETKTVALRQIAALSRPTWSLAVALIICVSGAFAQAPTPIPASNAQSQVTTTNTPEAEPAPTIAPEELEALVAPIALYPDPLLIQVLAASTYPLEIVQLKQWMDENKKLKGKTLAEAVVQQSWDPSVQALSAFPAVLNKLANKIQWTTDLGNAFLAQQDDLMDAVQRLREKAQANGALKTNDKQTVTTETTNTGEQAITIEPAQRDVVYVPTYNTQTVYGDSGYSDYSGYSGYSGSGSGYDYSYIGYAAAAAAGAAYGYYWGDYNWRDGYAEVNYNNYYNSKYNQNWKNNSNWSSNASNSNNNSSSANNNANSSSNNASNWSNKLNNLNGSDKSTQGLTQGTGRWQHDPAHRGNAPYGNSNLANRFGQANNRLSGGAGNRGSQPATARSANQLAQGNGLLQQARGSAGHQASRANLAGRNGGGARSSTRPPNAGAPNRVGNRMPSNWPNAARGGAFGPSNGDLARAFSGRGAESMRPPAGFRGGPPSGLNAGGPPMRGGPPGGGFRGGPPMGGGLPGGLPGGGAPPPPPPPPPP